MQTQKVAMLGLGLMGGGMARRLLGAGFAVTVYNRTPEKAAALGAEGATIAGTPREAAATADVVIAMLADDTASRNVWLGKEGALASGGAKAGALLIDCSTISPAWVKELSHAATAGGCDFLDAPVTGSKPQAAAGELFFMAGGTAAAYERARPFFAVMGRDSVHLGPVGSGALVKLINNFVCGVQIVALAEALTLIEHTDLDRTKALAVLTDGAPGSPLVKIMSQRMTASDFTPNFLLKLMTKDIHYALHEAQERSVPLAMGEAALAVFQQGMAAGLADKDFSSIVQLLRNQANRAASPDQGIANG